jgi:hypothetical protein
MKYICIGGQMRAGKNVIGDYICRRLGFTETSFAKPVKEIFCRAFGVDMDFVEKWKVREECPPGFNKTVRQTLQFIGDGFRASNPNVWVDYAFANNPVMSCYTDGRYVNELRRVKAEGGVNILLRRPSHENNCDNESEAQIKRLVDWFVANDIPEGRFSDQLGAPEGCNFVDFFLVNDGDVRGLYAKLDRLVIPRLSPQEKAIFCG